MPLNTPPPHQQQRTPQAQQANNNNPSSPAPKTTPAPVAREDRPTQNQPPQQATTADTPLQHKTPTNLTKRLAAAAADIKLAHSVFALPFAVLATFLARPADSPWTSFSAQLTLVILCMIAARTWAMLVNRWADANLDANNPRTINRAIPAGRLTRKDTAAFAIASALLFIALAAAFYPLFQNPWPLILSTPTLAFIAFYSFTKRFTLLCHIALGAALALSPIAATIAINPQALTTTPAIYPIAAMVLAWVAGFDIIYALQDEQHDRSTGLHSIPAKLGTKNAIRISRALHTTAVIALIAAATLEPRFGPLFYAATTATAILLITEHTIIHKRGIAGLNAAFFTVNGILSITLATLATTDILLHNPTTPP